MDHDVLFLNVAPANMDEPLDGEATSRVQVAKTGTFKDPRYGTFSITTRDFARWMQNFQTLASPEAGRMGLPVDVDHGPEKRGETEAAGWVTKLDTLGQDGKTGTPAELWATVQWNPLGATLIKDKRYAYLSPSYQNNLRDEKGVDHGTALVGIALTNRPFLSMATVTLSADVVLTAEAVVVEPPPSDSQDTMNELLKSLAAKLGVEEDEAKVLARVDELSARPAESKTLAQMAQESGNIVLSAQDFAVLRVNAEHGAEAAKTLHTMRFDSAFDKAKREARVLDNQREHYEKLYGVDADTTVALMESAPPVVNTEPRGSGAAPLSTAPGDQAVAAGLVGPEDARTFAVDEESMEIHTRAVALAAARNIDYEAALDQAIAGVTV